MVAASLMTVEEYMALCERGVFGDRRTELVDGEIEFEMGHGPRHARTSVQALLALSWTQNDTNALYTDVTVALSPVDTRDPDILLGRRVPLDRKPLSPRDVLLAIEISDATLQKDLQVKRRQYAVSGIPEYWSIDPVERKIHIFRDPVAGDYQTTLILDEGEGIVLQGRIVRVADLLP